MSWRRFLTLLTGLSARSRFALAQRDGGPVRYATRDEGLAEFHRIGR